MEITTHVIGVENAIAALRDLNVRVATKVMQKAIRAGAEPFLTAVRRLAPIKTGIFKRSLTKKIKTYGSSGTVVAIIGQNKLSVRRSKAALKRTASGNFGGISGRGDLVPIHLVDNPTGAHSMAKNNRIFTRKGNVIKAGVVRVKIAGKWVSLSRARIHPGTRGSKFVERAATSSKEEAMSATLAKLEQEVMGEAAQIGSQ